MIEDERIKKIINLVAKYVLGDFNARETISGKGDEPDAIIAGLNILAEEMEAIHVAERMHLENVEESEKRFQNLIQNAPDAIITIDENGIITNWNPEAEKMFGWKEVDAIGKTLSQTIIPEKFQKVLEKGLKDFLTTGEGAVLNKPIELSGLRKDLTEFPIELKVSFSKINKPPIFIGFVRDITERKKAKEKIFRLNKELEQKVQELEISNKEMESFSYSVSHDLRAPVRAISGFAKMLGKKYDPKFDEEGKDLLNTITSESTRMGRLIDDLLTFSRLGKNEIQKTKVDMTALAKEVIEELLKLGEQKYKAKITVNNLLPSYCDKVLIRQVLVNLISNSLKYSFPKPAPLIEIGSFSEENFLVYYVKDTGVGFDMKFYDKLFGVFQRLHDPEQFTGTGIGLSIVKRIIIRHGGRVWAEGKIDEGATFYFSLPKSSNLAQ
ncbi:MAG: PAS domain S-box protein [Bacteroidota bacterium]|nr:PAS domain S-box protein [Bacteroidota bacterium]